MAVMNDTEARRAAELLRKQWDEGRRLSSLPREIRPQTRAEGYAVQAHIADDANLFGWKIAATSIAGQRHINVAGPIAGRIFSHMIASNGGVCSLKGNTMRLAEPEFAFGLARDLPPRSALYTTGEALAAVGTLHPAIELPDSRYDEVTQAGEAQIIADNACAHRFVLGPATTADWRSMDLVEMRPVARVGERYVREGHGATVLGDPRDALTWLVNEVSSLGLTLRAGLVVTTGTCCAPLDIRPGETLSVDYGPLGAVSVSFSD
jgi:2-keto-4-pentenoate hydratase